MMLSCHACGATFRTALAEAKHRHNFPVRCKRNRRFARFTAASRAEEVRAEHPTLLPLEVDCPACDAYRGRPCREPEESPVGAPYRKEYWGLANTKPRDEPHEERRGRAFSINRGQHREEAPISNRLHNVLLRAEVEWMGAVSRDTDAQLLRLCGMGHKSLEELRAYQRGTGR